ncbi:MAG TPA: anti-sigma F factor [Candidatus Caccosoma faecigallinarum]|uniref:Anti-sigma F factor n=1 Tax=Candidatus Caccosoma faecigallinarum TaxID=2840720 RepID=A0A9D1KB05_9FIRM|nr:anti-sigma F factor [Firmicutes bacterium CAG:631]HIT17800.1 anti-sigma F factor [Candidatus Caccosoma faecigallinarum]
MTNKLEIKIAAMLENEGVVRNAVASFVSSYNPTLEEIIDIKTILSEAVSNAIIHGYEFDKTKDVYVKATINDHVLEIIVQDYGKGIENVQEALKNHFSTKKENEKTGIGFTIMRSLSDQFEIQSSLNVGTKLKIIKILQTDAIKAN